MPAGMFFTLVLVAHKILITLKSQRQPLEYFLSVFSDRMMIFSTHRIFFWRNYVVFLSSV